MANVSSLAQVASASPPAVAEPVFLLELIVADLHWTSVQVAMLGLATSAAADSHARFNLRALRHLTHTDACVMRLALRYVDAAKLASPTAEKLDRLYADLGAAMKQLGPFIEAATLSSLQREQMAKHLPTLRKLATAAADALAALEPLVRSELNPNYLHDSALIRQVLSRAARGELSEGERRGDLAPPALKQRRQSPRATVNKPCRFAYEGGETEAILVDVSRNGLGLQIEANAPVTVKQPAVVRVGERALEGEVVRRLGSQVGFALKRPIAITDPLFQAG